MMNDKRRAVASLLAAMVLALAAGPAVAALVFYVATTGADTNSGSAQAIIVTGTAATTNGTATVQLDAGTDLSGVTANVDTIRIASRTDGRNSSNIFAVIGKDDDLDRVTVTPSPAATSGQSWTIGGAWLTLQRAADVISAGEKLWVKIGTYTTGMQIKRAGALTNPIVVTGYKTTPGDVAGELAANSHLWPSNSHWDSWRVVIDGQESLTAGIKAAGCPEDKLYYVFENFHIKDCAGIGVNLLSYGNIALKNCRVSGCISAPGAYITDPGNSLESCCFDNNGANAGGPGVVVQGVMLNCDVFGNDGEGAVGSNTCSVLFCRFWGNGGDGLYLGMTQYQNFPAIVNNTFIGKDQETGYPAIHLSGTSAAIVVNNIFYDWDIGIKCEEDLGLNHVARNNLFSNNNTDRLNFPVGLGDISAGDPGFVNAATNDYRLRFGSPARGKGFPEFLDLGACQRKERHGGLWGLWK